MMSASRAHVLVFLLLASMPGTTAGPGPLPALELEVLYGTGGGPDRFRSDFTHNLIGALRARGCYPEVVEGGDGETVLFRVLLEAPLVESRDSLSIHGSMKNRAERGTSSTTTVVQVHAELQILLPAGRDLFRSKKIRLESSYRPTFAWEDGTAEARDRLIRDLSSRAAGFACKAAGRKLKAILAQAPPDPR